MTAKSFKLENKISQLASRLVDAKKRQLCQEILAYPIYLSNFLKLGGWFKRDGQYEEAIILFQYGVRRHPSSYTLLMKLGSAYENTGEETAAIQTYARIIRKFPDRFSPYLRLEKLYRRSLNLGKAIRLYQEIPSVNPVKEKSYQRLYQIYARQGDWEKAVAVLREANKNFGESYRRCLALGKIYLRQRQYLDAVQVFESAVAFRPRSSSTRIWLAIALQELGNLRLAEYEFNEILKVNPDSFPALILLAELKIREKRLEEAQPILEKLDKISPNNARVIICRGWIALKQDNQTEAIACCRVGLQKTSLYFIWEQVMAHRIMARAYEVSGDDEERRFQHLMADSLFGKDTYHSLITTAEKLIKLDKGHFAARVLNRILELFPGNTRAQVGLGEVMLREGKHEEAIAICRQALQRVRPIFVRETIRAHTVMARAFQAQKKTKLYKQEIKIIRALLRQLYLKPGEKSQIKKGIAGEVPPQVSS